MTLPAAKPAVSLPASAESVELVRQLEAAQSVLPQVPIHTDHVIHGGLYARTIMIPAGVSMTGAQIEIPTILIVSGDCTITTADGPVRITGYHVIPGSAGRKSAFYAHADTHMTMLFPSSAKTVRDAESEFTGETGMLMSHDNTNTIVITGE